MRLDQGGQIYYGYVTTSGGKSTMSTCGNKRVVVASGSSLRKSTHACIVMRADLDIATGPKPAPSPTPSPPGATAQPLPAPKRFATAITSDPILISRRDAKGNIASVTSDTSYVANDTLRSSLSGWAVRARSLGLAAMTSDAAPDVAGDYGSLCAMASDGVVVLTPRLDLFDGPVARTANLTMTVRYIGCPGRSETVFGDIADGVHLTPAPTFGYPWSSTELADAVNQLSVKLFLQFIALQQ